MALSIIQAFESKESGAITRDEYIHILLSRCLGEKHEDDNNQGTHPYLRNKDPFGHIVFHWTDRLGIVDDIEPVEAVFKAYRHGTLDDVKTKLALLNGTPAELSNGTKKSLAMLAVQDRRADVLKFCLDQGGFPLENTFLDEADTVNADDDPQTFDVLNESRQFQNNDRWVERAEEMERRKAEQDGVPYKRHIPLRPGAKFDQGGPHSVDW